MATIDMITTATRTMSLGTNTNHRQRGGLPTIIDLRIIDNMVIIVAPQKIGVEIILGVDREK